MSTRPRRLVLLLPLALMVAACGPVASGSQSPVTTPRPTASTSAEANPPPGTPTGAPAAGQTDTGWGRMWDTVPAGFPVFPGATPADDAGGEPASARFAVEGGDPLAIATWFQDARRSGDVQYARLQRSGRGRRLRHRLDRYG